MTLSLNEFETLCTRAARGAGLPWGLAEEAGKAARCLAEFGLPGAQLLVRILTHFDGKPLSERGCEALDGPWRREGGPMCPLIVGAALSDCARRLETCGSIEMRNLECPVLLLPHAAEAARQRGGSISVEWQGVRAVVQDGRFSIAGADADLLCARTDRLLCRFGGKLSQPLPRRSRVTISEICFAQLSDLAFRTYAPATDRSRLLGAGPMSDD